MIISPSRLVCQPDSVGPDFRVFACPALGWTVTLAADHITTSQSGRLSNKCGICRTNVESVFRTNVETI